MDVSFYTSHSKWSDPGPDRNLLVRERIEPAELSNWIARLLQHPRGAETALHGFTPEQGGDLVLRRVSDMLSCAAERNLLDRESGGRKIGGVCRDFALMAVSSFRENGVPARLRVGFADYLVTGRWEDHWLCEYYDAGRWKLLDVEIAAIDQDRFDATDVPGDRFMMAATAWTRLRTDPDTGQRFGVAALDLGGAWFVAGSLFRDMAALRKLELKPWDYWGISESLARNPSKWPSDAETTLDNLSACLSQRKQDLLLYDLPAEVVSFLQDEPQKVPLED